VYSQLFFLFFVSCFQAEIKSCEAKYTPLDLRVPMATWAAAKQVDTEHKAKNAQPKFAIECQVCCKFVRAADVELAGGRATQGPNVVCQPCEKKCGDVYFLCPKCFAVTDSVNIFNSPNTFFDYDCLCRECLPEPVSDHVGME